MTFRTWRRLNRSDLSSMEVLMSSASMDVCNSCCLAQRSFSGERSSVLEAIYPVLCSKQSSALDHSASGVSQGSPWKRHDRQPHPALTSLSAEGWKWKKGPSCLLVVFTDSQRPVLVAQTDSAEKGTRSQNVLTWKCVCSSIVVFHHAGWRGLLSHLQRLIVMSFLKLYTFSRIRQLL